MPLPSGTLLNNRYRIVSILGQGGMGAVYRATDENLNIPVAIKENLFLTEEYTRQFQHEARILANLRHPGLPHVSDYFYVEGTGQYLAMDYIEGEDLRQRMERSGPLSERETILIGISICEALSYLHTRQPAIVHRDIKPGNVKVTQDGQAVLVDFGLAKVMQGNQPTQTGARAMTPGYSPPEQYGTSRTDARSDIYSLGATLYAVLTGTIPEDSLACMTGKAELTDIRELRPKINRRLADIIHQALEVDPDDRFQSADEFRQALIECGEMAAYFRERPTLTPPPPELLDIANSPTGDRFQSGPRRKSHPSNRSSRARRRQQRAFLLVPVFILIIFFVYMTLMLRPDLPGAVLGFFAGRSASAAVPSASPITALTQTPSQETPQSADTPTGSTTTPQPSAAAILTPTVLKPTSTPLGGGTSQIAFSSNRTGKFQVWVMNSQGKQVRQITSMPDGACQPAWSPDGMRLIFTSPCTDKRDQYEGSGLYIINLDGSNLVQLPASPEGDFDPAWSPDGQKIAFTSLRTGLPSIFVLSLDTNDVVELSQSRYPDRQPTWSLTSHQIAFIRTIVYNQVWVMNENGDQQQQFSVSGAVNDTHPAWSSDGEIVYYSQVSADGSMPWLAGMRYQDRGNPREFTIPANREVNKNPIANVSISPDGAWVVYESWPEGTNHDIYLMAPNGTNQQRLTADPGYDFDPVWRPAPDIP